MENFLTALLIGILDYWKSLGGFQFYYNNPLFWVLTLLAILFLSYIWEVKKAFSFCIAVAVILLLTTRVENLASRWLINIGETLDLTIIRLIAILIIVSLSLIYLFLR